jgi:hypothetical protein
MKIAITSNGAFVDQRDGSLVEGRLSVYLRDSDDLATTYTLEGNDFVQAQNPVLLHSGLPDDTLFADAGIYRLKVEKYTGPEGQMSVDADPAYFEQIDVYEVGFDWDSAVSNAQNVDSIDDLRSVDPSVGSVNVLSYYSIGDAPSRTYVWDGASVDQIDGGYVVGSDVSDTGRWILLWGDEILPCSVYGVSAGNEANLNSLFQYQRLVGSFSLVTAPCVRFTRGEYTSNTSFVTDKELVFDGDAKFTLATIQCPKVRIVGSRSSYVGNFVFTAPDAEAHSSWFRTLQGFWKCDAPVLCIDDTDYFESNTIAGNINLGGKKIIGSTHLDAVFGANAFYAVDQSTSVTGRIFGPNDYVKVSGHGDELWLTSGSWDPGLISAGHHQEWQNTPDLDLFENADRWVETMVERRSRMPVVGDTIDFQYRKMTGLSLDVGLFTDIRNLVCNILNVNNSGADVTLRNVSAERLHASCNSVTLDRSAVYFGEEPSVAGIYGSSSELSVGGAAWRSNGISVSLVDSKVSGLNLDRNGDNETKDSTVGFTGCTLTNCTLGSKSLSLSGNSLTGCTVKVYPYMESSDYRLDLVFRGNSSMGANPVEFTKAVESEGCFGCILNVAIVGNQFLGNAEGLRMRYWSNRTGIAYSNTFVKESASNSIVYSGNSGLCPKESGKGILISDNTDYVHQDVGGIDVYTYKNNAFRGFPKFSGMRTFWYSCNTSGESDTMIKWKLNEATLPLFLQSFGYYMMAHDDSLSNGSYFDLCPSTVGSFIKIDPVASGISAKII